VPRWGTEYRTELSTRFAALSRNALTRVGEVTTGRVVPALQDLAIGEARRRRGAVIFVDICGFSARTSSPEEARIDETLLMLNVFIPSVMAVVYDHGGYIEKNTGDGVMAVLSPAGATDRELADEALSVARGIFYVVRDHVNPFLEQRRIEPIEIRVGMDLGTLTIARMGVATGGAALQRNFLTVVSPAANLASKMVEDIADRGDLMIGDLLKNAATFRFGVTYTDVTPRDWEWVYFGNGARYPVWKCVDNAWDDDTIEAVRGLFLPAPR
jgi:adenylate cyclase